MICRLELESSSALRDTILKTMLVNLSGRAGAFSAADLMQEFFNRLLEAIVDKKGVEYGDQFIRDVISRNLHHFARIKLDLREGIGLSKRSGRHSAPHLNPEIATLLKTYYESELHRRRPGRVYNDIDKDDFQRGVSKLLSGKLKKWIHDTTSSRGLLAMDTIRVVNRIEGDAEESNDVSDDEDSDDDAAGGDEITQSAGYTEVIDGELIMDSFENLTKDVDNWHSYDEQGMFDENIEEYNSDMDIS